MKWGLKKMMMMMGGKNLSLGGLMEEEGWRKGPWTAEEDKLLIQYVKLHGEGRWNSVARLAGLRRNGKSCRLRWVNYLRPDLKRGQITPHEEKIILELHARWGNRWSTIARSLPGRTDNEIKNYWRTHFKKKTKTSPEKSDNKSRTQLLKRQQQFHQQQLLQRNQLELIRIMSLLDDRAPYEPQIRQETAIQYPNTTDQAQGLPYYNNNYMFHENSYVPHDASNDDVLVDGLWNLDDVPGKFWCGY